MAPEMVKDTCRNEHTTTQEEYAIALVWYSYERIYRFNLGIIGQCV